jgi:tetratricopeptide (TPR) repeat protein
MKPLLFMVAMTQCCFGEEHWTEVKTPHFELFTTAGEKRGRDAVMAFEQVRGLFVALNVARPEVEVPVRIIMFQSEKEFAPFRPNEFSLAYYHPIQDHDYIVMGGLTTENYPAAVHEYVHVVIRRSGLKVPLAMNEGLADVYSTLKQVKGKVQIGSVLPGRLQTLMMAPLIPIPELLRVDQKSPLYNERDRASIFYAESWGLMHMLLLSPEYSPKFGKFISTLQSGMSAQAALETVTGRSSAQILDDFVQYIRGANFNAGVFDIKLEKPSEKPEAGAANSLEYGMALGQILTDLRHLPEAMQRFEMVARENPESSLPEAALGQLAWRAQDANAAKVHFGRAVDLKSTDATVYFNYAVLLNKSRNDDARLLAVLQQAVQLKPEIRLAHSFLADRYVAAEDYAHALEELNILGEGKPEEWHGYYQRLALVQMKLRNFGYARTAGEKALASATTPKEREESQGFLRFLDTLRH